MKGNKNMSGTAEPISGESWQDAAQAIVAMVDDDELQELAEGALRAAIEEIRHTTNLPFEVLEQDQSVSCVYKLGGNKDFGTVIYRPQALSKRVLAAALVFIGANCLGTLDEISEAIDCLKQMTEGLADDLIRLKDELSCLLDGPKEVGLESAIQEKQAAIVRLTSKKVAFEQKLVQHQATADKIAKQLVLGIARGLTQQIIVGLNNKIVSAFSELLSETTFMTQAAFEASARRSAGKPLKLTPGLRALTRRFALSNQKRLEAVIQETTLLQGGNKRQLNNHHHSLTPIWKEAKQIHKSFKHLGTWKDMIRAAHPDKDLPEDLLSRLDSPDSYEAAPSLLALEHAARLSGYIPGNYTIRTLQEHLAQFRKAKK